MNNLILRKYEFEEIKINASAAGIYILLNKINKKGIIGQTKNFQQRWSQYKNKLNDKTYENDHLSRSFRKYGKNNFCFIVLALSKIKKIRKLLEAFYIEILKTNLPEYGYNQFKGINDVTNPRSGCKWSKQEREKRKQKGFGKAFWVIKNDNEIIQGKNIKEFCKLNNLNYKYFLKMLYGKCNYYKNYRLYIPYWNDPIISLANYKKNLKEKFRLKNSLTHIGRRESQQTIIKRQLTSSRNIPIELLYKDGSIKTFRSFGECQRKTKLSLGVIRALYHKRQRFHNGWRLFEINNPDNNLTYAKFIEKEKTIQSIHKSNANKGQKLTEEQHEKFIQSRRKLMKQAYFIKNEEIYKIRGFGQFDRENGYKTKIFADLARGKRKEFDGWHLYNFDPSNPPQNVIEKIY